MGDAACWLHAICPECGRFIEDAQADGCPNCGADHDQFAQGDATRQVRATTPIDGVPDEHQKQPSDT